MTNTKLAPTVEAIDAWLARQTFRGYGPDGVWVDSPIYGVNIWTKGSRCRCIVSRFVGGGERGGRPGVVYYETIRGEGSSNGCRHTFIAAPDIVRAEGWTVG